MLAYYGSGPVRPKGPTMTVGYSIDGAVLTIHQGAETSAREFGIAISKALADPELPEPAYMLWDASSAPAEASRAKMQRLLKGFAALQGRIAPKVAMLVASERQYGVARMLSV